MRAICLAVLLFFSPIAMGAETPCTTQVYGDFTKEPDWNCPAPGEDALVPKLEIPNSTVALAKDTKAPFAGLLLDQNRVLVLGLRITGLRRLLWINAQVSKKQQDLEVARGIEVTKQDGQQTAAQRDALQARVAQLSNDLSVEKAWYRSWTFGFALGVIITSAATLGVVIATK